MNNSQRRILFVLVLLCLGAGFTLIIMRPSQSQQNQPSHSQDNPAAEFKNLSTATDSSSLKVEWRIVIARGTLKSKIPPVMDSPELDPTGETFLMELHRRYPDIQFRSPVAGDSPVDDKGACFPRIKYPYVHPELGTLHVSFPVALVFTPEKSGNRFVVVNNHEKYFNLAYDEIFFSSYRYNMQDIPQPMPITSLFRPTQLPQSEGNRYVTVGKTVLLESYSCYFQKGSKKLQAIDTHMLFYRLVRPAAL